MISHVTLGTNDLDRAARFWDPVMALLGHRLRPADPAAGWRIWQPAAGGRPLLILMAPFDGAEAAPGNGGMLGLLAPDRPTVDRAHAAGLAAGGRDEGAPGLRRQYHPDYYGAYLRDPDGNKLCIVCHDPA
ncbi:VOC family protein [Frigidibacter sp. MR17.14]|uniref:VOC family protein n=1 Tax=Frigidibacter sp. MR17.14 TaxID=3126509 RepID=UPI003012FBC8